MDDIVLTAMNQNITQMALSPIYELYNLNVIENWNWTRPDFKSILRRVWNWHYKVPLFSSYNPDTSGQ